ncbi:MAG: Cof-type HAD-IIB family hydrolase [Erysipelotrichaceae bacterium]|nr:Cof-type HAD-IIB family hydrolase [Erysipelotrichaceae bacterium]
MYKLIFSDLDETLLVNHHVPLGNQKAIATLKNKDVKFVVATGRAFNMIGEILQEVGTYEKENEYSICFNGGLIVENKDARILRFKGLSFDLAKQLFDKGKDLDVCTLIFTLDCCYIFHADPNEVQRKIDQKANFKVIDEYNMDFLKDDKIAKILFEKRDMDYLKDISVDLINEFDENVSFTFSSNRYLEMNKKGVNKGEAIHWLSDYLHVDIQDTVAIGDNYNDVSMMEEAGLGVCVLSSTQDIKDLCDYVTTVDYGDCAVAEVIERFIQ